MNPDDFLWHEYHRQRRRSQARRRASWTLLLLMMGIATALGIVLGITLRSVT